MAWLSTTRPNPSLESTLAATGAATMGMLCRLDSWLESMVAFSARSAEVTVAATGLGTAIMVVWRPSDSMPTLWAARLTV